MYETILASSGAMKSPARAFPLRASPCVNVALKRDVHDFKKESSDDPEQDIEFQPQLEHCKSSHHSIWMGTYVY